MNFNLRCSTRIFAD